MFRRSRKQAIKENALSASELAVQLAQDRKFRKRLLSAIKHSSEAGRRTRRGLGATGAISRLASDQTLQSELRSARTNLQRAYRQLEAKRRKRKLRRFTLLAGLAALAANPQLRTRSQPHRKRSQVGSTVNGSRKPRAPDQLQPRPVAPEHTR